MRIAIYALIPFLTAAIGYLFSLQYGQAREFWAKFKFWHKKIKAEISFSQSSLSEIFESGEISDPFCLSAKEYLAAKKINTELRFLSKEEISFLYKYLQNLGTTDKDSQLNFLNSLEPELENYSENAAEKDKKFRPLYVKLGFLLGLIVFILVI